MEENMHHFKDERMQFKRLKATDGKEFKKNLKLIKQEVINISSQMQDLLMSHGS